LIDLNMAHTLNFKKSRWSIFMWHLLVTKNLPYLLWPELNSQGGTKSISAVFICGLSGASRPRTPASHDQKNEKMRKNAVFWLPWQPKIFFSSFYFFKMVGLIHMVILVYCMTCYLAWTTPLLSKNEKR
jgi:hypothetical protein